MKNIYIAHSFIDRVLGMLIPRKSSKVFVLLPCKSIHTFHMKREIDVAFISKEGLVIYSERNVGPRRVIKHKDSFCVLERYSNTQKEWINLGQRIEVTAG